MSIVSTCRHQPAHLPRVSLGPKRVATDAEIGQINRAIVLLNKAKAETVEASMLYDVSEAFRIARSLVRARNDL